jgi:hypothetical protein
MIFLFCSLNERNKSCWKKVRICGLAEVVNPPIIQNLCSQIENPQSARFAEGPQI